MIERFTAIVAASIFVAARVNAEPPSCRDANLTLPTPANAHVADEYPILSTVLLEQGTTIVRFAISADGKTSNHGIVTSSGSMRLDEAAILSVRNWLYKPAMSGGVPTVCMMVAAVQWVLHDTPPPPKAQ
jgi:TonB family protein